MLVQDVWRVTYSTEQSKGLQWVMGEEKRKRHKTVEDEEKEGRRGRSGCVDVN